jgi:kumamolisin
MNYLSKLTVFSASLLTLAMSTVPLRAVDKASIKSHVAASQTVSFDVYIPLQNRAQLDKDLADLQNVNSPKYHQWLKPAEFNARYAASPAQVQAIREQLAAYGLTATLVNARRIHVTGQAGAVEQAFSTSLGNGTYSNGKPTIVATQPLVKSGAMASTHAIVTGLSGMIRMKTHSYPMASPQNRYSNLGPYWFDDLKQAYSFPSYQAYDGTGVTIGILMSGAFNQHDMDLYFGHEHLATPSYSTVTVDGGLPFSINNSFETHLDLQQSGGMAPKANIILYNIPDLSDGSIIDGLFQIIDDNTADVVSMSFGGPEIFFTAADNDGEDFTFIPQFEDEIFAQGNAQGITFIASSGDAGAKSAVPVSCFNGDPNCGNFVLSAEFPASSPHVVGVGGTNLITSHAEHAASLNSAYVSENAYGDPLTQDIFYGTSATGGYWGSGGGVSMIFPKPDFQTLVNTGDGPFRNVPDVSLHMGGCPGGAICNANDSADLEVIGGFLFGVIGTSASAPDFAGLTALAIQKFGSRFGNENYYIYALANLQASGAPINVFNNAAIKGFNGYYYANGKGYNRVIGNGTVNGKNFMLAPQTPAAGIPQTPSNP